MERRTLYASAFVAVVAAGLAQWGPGAYDAWRVDRAVARNVAARGGQAAWDALKSVTFVGTMDLGAGQQVSYQLDQTVPDTSCFTYEFADKAVTQCTNGQRGWKRAPYTGREDATPLDKDELREATTGADPRGLLIDYDTRGLTIDYLGHHTYEGRAVELLRVRTPSGGERLVYLDEETGLELNVVSTRKIAGKELRVDTLYSDWEASDGVLFPHRLASRTEGDDVWYAFEVRSVQVNPRLDPTTFQPPASLGP